ncbi:hypothetical protein ACLB2K_068090 [Fragaria x ananassa]
MTPSQSKIKAWREGEEEAETESERGRRVEVKKVERACLRNPVKIEVASKYSTVDTVQQHVWLTPHRHKDFYLVYILTKKCHCTTMVFTEQCDSATLRNLGIRAIPLHGNMSQQKRLGALNMFKSGQCNVLICTDVASRGSDIPSVDMVINYDIPKNPKNYIDRVRRTARAGRSGAAMTFLSSPLELPGQGVTTISCSSRTLQCQETVVEARRLANSKLNEKGGKKRKWRGNDDDDDDEEDIVILLSNQQNGKSKKMYNKRFKKR